MKKLITIIVLLFSTASIVYSQGGPGYYGARYAKMAEGDSVLTYYLWNVYVTNSKKGKAQVRKANRNHIKYNKLIYNVRKVYPIALQVKDKLTEVEAHLHTLTDEKARKAYINKIEKELKAQYTPILKEMTFSQGKILIKLVDRETSRTSFELLREFKSGFSAFLWQNVARMFGANLKQTYDKDGDDWEIEEIIKLYEMGII